MYVCVCVCVCVLHSAAKILSVQQISLHTELPITITIFTDQTLEPLVYHHLVTNDSNQILLTRMMYLDRQEHLQKMCHNYIQDFKHLSNITQYREIYDHLLVDQKHRLLYCYVPKVCLFLTKNVIIFSHTVSFFLYNFNDQHLALQVSFSCIIVFRSFSCGCHNKHHIAVG